MHELELLEVHRQTAFAVDDRGRMLYERAPDRSPGRSGLTFAVS
jgi:hypothetical protein